MIYPIMTRLHLYIQRKKSQILTLWSPALFLLLLVCHAQTAEPVPIRHDSRSPSESELKATYLYNFLKFVRWPDDPCNLPEGRSHQIAVLGDSPFNDELRVMHDKLKEHDPELEITFYGPFSDTMELPCCCLLFIAESELNHLPAILKKLAGLPVLTVSDNDASMARGVMITLVPWKNKIRWAINRQPVIESGLKMNSKLLDIAVKVIDEKAL